MTGLVRDKASNFGATPEELPYRVASSAATGFGLAAVAHAAHVGTLDKKTALDQVKRTLVFLENQAPHWNGWFYHFMDWQTGARAYQSEYSTIDSALLMMGALYAANVLQDASLLQIVDRLYERMDFEIMRNNDGAHPDKKTLSMGWIPETGFIPYEWEIYSEHLALYYLGLGHPTRPLRDSSWLAWQRVWKKDFQGRDFLGQGLPLFIHQYNFLFLDPASVPIGKGDWMDNSRLATGYDKDVAMAQTSRFRTFREGFWGLSASESQLGYRAFSTEFYDGTVCPGCVGASAPFVPEVMGELESWSKSPWAKQIWGKYGFVDAFNLDPEWFSRDVLGITVGALYLSLANADPKHPTLWSVFRDLPFVHRAAKVAHRMENQVGPRPTSSACLVHIGGLPHS